MAKPVQNPLFEPQREKAGAETFSKFEYQYHWALYRALKQHKGDEEYALFVEIHEDVVLADSLDAAKVRFEFNQVKTLGKRYTVNSLTKLKKGSSVLGKLISSIKDKPYGNKVSSLNLISVNGFSLPLKTPGLSLDKISLDDLDNATNKALKEAIRSELSLSKLPETLYFIVPELLDKQFQDLLIAEITKLVKSLFPNHLYDSQEIYRVLYDDLKRKGIVTVDIKQWQDFLDRKALTCNTVTKVINQFTQLKDEATLLAGFGNIAKEIGLGTLQSKALEQCFNRYRQLRVGTRSTLQIDTAEEIKNGLAAADTKNVTDWDEMLLLIKGRLSKRVADQFLTDDDLRGAIIYEFLTR